MVNLFDPSRRQAAMSKEEQARAEAERMISQLFGKRDDDKARAKEKDMQRKANTINPLNVGADALARFAGSGGNPLMAATALIDPIKGEKFQPTEVAKGGVAGAVGKAGLSGDMLAPENLTKTALAAQGVMDRDKALPAMGEIGKLNVSGERAKKKQALEDYLAKIQKGRLDESITSRKTLRKQQEDELKLKRDKFDLEKGKPPKKKVETESEKVIRVQRENKIRDLIRVRIEEFAAMPGFKGETLYTAIATELGAELDGGKISARYYEKQLDDLRALLLPSDKDIKEIEPVEVDDGKGMLGGALDFLGNMGHKALGFTKRWETKVGK